MNVLILGSGGREHALAWKAAQSPRLKKLYCAPGSDAISSLADAAPLDILDGKAVAAFCKKNKIDLVLIGPEAPLAAGVADILREAGVKTFGPGRDAARLEASKSFAKLFMKRHGVPTARFEVFEDSQLARSAAEAKKLPLVIKADGLAAGKGVYVCRTTNEALGAVTELMDNGRLGDAGRTIVLEDCLQGPEASILMFCDGKDYRLLPPSRDHKRLKDNDQGPNTGGMGVFAPAPLEPGLLGRIKTEIIDKVMAGLAADKLDYRGLLYIGLMLTPEGPKVLEFNCRFGDPETQALMPLLETDLLDLAEACADQRLGTFKVSTKTGACVCVTLAAAGYPDRPVKGRRIDGLETSDALVFHAGTIKPGSEWMTAGGRVLGVTAMGADLPQAREKAYAAVSRIRFEGMQFRTDIAANALAAAQ